MRIKLIVIFLFAVPFSIQAATFSLGPNETAGLINAIKVSNTNGESNVINLSPGNYNLSDVEEDDDDYGETGLPTIEAGARITINGPSLDKFGKPTVKIIRQVGSVNFRILLNKGKLTINRVSIENGTVSGIGGGIANDTSGVLTLSYCTVAFNTATSESFGGGIGNRGKLTLIKSTVKSNEATSGGGIIHFGGKLRILSSTIASNFSHFGGGGLEIADLTQDRSATAEAINSTISMNEALVRGGGVYVFSGSQAKFVHVTISSNVAAESGGGIQNEGDLVTIKNTIIGNNYLTGFSQNDCFGTITSHSYNIISANTCNFISSAGDQVGTFSNPLDPGLDPLGDYNQGNGAPDMHALKLTSPAIDIVPRAECEKGDQRSFARSAVIYSSRTPCDAGAYERNAKPFCLGVLTPFVATIVGTSDDDVLMGTSGSDIIHGLGGDDQIKGLGAGDFICGGTGNDTIDGDDGSDVLFGQDGDDIVNGGANSDVIWGAGEVGNNELNGNGGNDTIVGGIGDDAMNGGAGRNDRCNGSSEFDEDTAVNCETVTKVP